MIGVADEVVKHLLELAGVDQGGRQRVAQVEFDGDVAGRQFRFEQAQGFVEQGVEVVAFAARGGGPHGVEELFEDGVEAADFLAGGGEALFQRVLLLPPRLFLCLETRALLEDLLRFLLIVPEVLPGYGTVALFDLFCYGREVKDTL